MITITSCFVNNFENYFKDLDKDTLQQRISDNIVQLRKQRGISQSELGALCNIEKSNMSRIESGKISPSLITLYKISTALGIEFYELFKIEFEY